MTRLILVRHGETEWNQKRKMQGQTDIPLSGNGISQAEKVAERLKNEKIDAIYSSPLQRAYQTASAIAEEHNLGVIKEKNLQEIGYGIFEGKCIDKLKTTDLWKEREKDKYNFKPPKGESYREATERAVNAVEKIIKDNHGKTILISSHSALIKSILIGLLNLDTVSGSHMRLHNTSITEIKFEKDKPVLKVLNDANHL